MKDWPAFSPDLNPIENVWGIMKMELETREIMKKLDLIEAVTEKYKKIDDTINNLINSFQRRLIKCIENEGDKIPY